MPPIHWNEHSAHLTYSVSELYSNSDLTDCILDVEGKSILVHKTILAACSPYLKKLLKSHYAITLIPIDDVTYKDMKLILDFMYYGEADVCVTDVSSIVKTAELLEMTSLKQSVCHCFGKKLSCNNTRARSAVSCRNVIRNVAKNTLEEQVERDSAVLYMREERLNSKSQNTHMQSLGDSTERYFNDFKEVSEKLKEDQSKSSVPITCDSFNKSEQLDDENVNDELAPVTYVSVSEIKEPMETHQDSTMCFDSTLRDPLQECSGILNVKKECNFQIELQVKKEPKDEINVPESMSDDVTSEETHDLKIKFQSVCVVSEADVKEEKIFETGQFLNHSAGGDDTGTPPLEPESELLKSCAQHFSSIDLLRNMNEEEHNADTSKITFLSKRSNKTPALMQIARCGERKELMLRTGNNSLHIASSNTMKQTNDQLSLPRDHLQPLETVEGHGLTEKLQTNLTKLLTPKTRNYSCIKCRKSYVLPIYLERHMWKTHRKNTVENPLECEICKRLFVGRSHLLIHMRIHTGEKPFECDICKKSFSAKSSLRVHVLTHMAVKPFECKICKKSFNQSVHLRSHMQTHTGEKPFECGICKQSFSYWGGFKKHVRTHIGT